MRFSTWFIGVLAGGALLLNSGCSAENGTEDEMVASREYTPEFIIRMALEHAYMDDETRKDMRGLSDLLAYPILWLNRSNNYVVAFEYYSNSEDILFVKEVVLDRNCRPLYIKSHQGFVTGRYAGKDERDELGFFFPMRRSSASMLRWTDGEGRPLP